MGSNPSSRTRAALGALFTVVAGGCSVVADLGNDYGVLDSAVLDAGKSDATSTVDGGQDARGDTLDSTVGVETGVPIDGSAIAPDAPLPDAPRDSPAPPPPPDGCLPKTCASVNAVCGMLADGCGAVLQCGSCGPGGVCASNACTPDGGVITVDGGGVVTLYDGGAGSSPYYIAAGNGYVYWTDSVLGGVRYVIVPQVGPLTPLPTVKSAATGSGQTVIVASGGVACWADQSQMALDSFDPDAGAQPLTPVIGDGVPFGVAVAMGGGVFYTTSTGFVDESSPSLSPVTQSMYQSLGYVVFDAMYLYWVVPSGQAVQQAHVGSPVNLTTLAVNQDQPTGITVGGGQVYWTNQGDGTIRHAPTGGDGGTLPELVATDSPGVANIVYAYPYVYWTNDVSGTVSRCLAPDCGGGPVVLAERQVRPFGIAVDSSYVYWTNEGNGSGAGVMAIHK